MSVRHLWGDTAHLALIIRLLLVHTGIKLFNMKSSSEWHHQRRCSEQCLSCCVAGMIPAAGNAELPSALWCSFAFLLSLHLHPTPPLMSPQLEPVGKKTDNQQIGNEISLKCPSEVSYKRVCIFMVVLGVAGSLLVLSPTAWSTVSVSRDGGLEVNFLTVMYHSQPKHKGRVFCLPSIHVVWKTFSEGNRATLEHWSGWLGWGLWNYLWLARTWVVPLMSSFLLTMHSMGAVSRVLRAFCKFWLCKIVL